MKKVIRRIYFAPLMLALLMAACSSQPETANNNTPTNSPVAQNGTVPASSDTSSPPVAPPAVQPTSPPAEGARVEPEGAAPKITAPGQLVASGPAPKLVVPPTRIDFGKQPQGTSLNRTITIRNGGNALLKIDAVEPS